MVWGLIQYDWCSYNKRLVHRHLQREDHVKTLEKTMCEEGEERSGKIKLKLEPYL